MRKGLFITFEGPDGAGKSTQIHRLMEFLEEEGHSTLLTREPGGTPLGEKIREIILDKNHREMDHMTEALLYAASRAQLVSQVLIPALAEGRTVICDRFVDSSIAYQGYGRRLGQPVELINGFATGGLTPDLTVLLFLDPNEGKRRAEMGREPDRLESESLSFHREVYRGYMELAAAYPDRIVQVDGTGSIEEIQETIRSRVITFLEDRNE